MNEKEEAKLLNEKIKVSEAMQKHGGSFVKRLGAALVFADPENTRKIKKTWQKYWAEYLVAGYEEEKKVKDKKEVLTDG